MNSTSILNQFNLKGKDGKFFQGKVAPIIITLFAIVALISAAIVFMTAGMKVTGEAKAVVYAANPELSIVERFKVNEVALEAVSPEVLQARRYTITSVQKPIDATQLVNPEVLQARRYTIIPAQQPVSARPVDWEGLQVRRYVVTSVLEGNDSTPSIDFETLSARKYAIVSLPRPAAFTEPVNWEALQARRYTITAVMRDQTVSLVTNPELMVAGRYTAQK